MSDEVAIRRAVLTETDTLADLYLDSQRAVVPETSLDQQTARKWVRKAVVFHEVWVLAGPEGEPVGLLALSERDLEVLDVAPAHRGHGYGTLLMEHAKSSRPGGLRMRLAKGRTDSREFLTRNGFVSQSTQEPYWEDFVWDRSSEPARAADQEMRTGVPLTGMEAAAGAVPPSMDVTTVAPDGADTLPELASSV